MIAPGVATEEIAESHLRSLVENGVAERRTVEYKSELPGGKDEARKEFLADVSSFANAAGGDLLYGMAEEDGVPTGLCPLTIIPEKQRLTVEQVIRGGIDPRIHGVTVREIPVQGGHVLLIRIPKSWVGPHAVTYKKTFRFYSRTSAGKYPLDVAELRSAFLGASGVAEQIRNFRADRLGSIAGGDAPIPLAAHPKIVVHLVPLDAFAAQQSLVLSATEGSGVFRPLFQDSGGMGTRWNIDGLLTYDYDEAGGRVFKYAQLFRNGIFEGVDAYTFRQRHTEGDPYVYGTWLEFGLNRGLANPLEVLRAIGVQPPIAVLVSIIGVQNFVLRPGPARVDVGGWRRFDRDVLLLPDVTVEDFSINYREDLPRLLRPAVDAFYQAGGWPGSSYYDDEGKWGPSGLNCAYGASTQGPLFAVLGGHGQDSLLYK